MHFWKVSSPILAAVFAIAGLTMTPPAEAADKITAREVTAALFKAHPGEAVDFSGKDLQLLDLSGLDFKGARLAGADLYGADVRGANLAGADLSGVRLDRATLIRADFSGANLARATLLRPNIYADLAADLKDAPRFTGADLREVRVMAQLDGADFKGADLTRADFSPHELSPGQGNVSSLTKNLLKSCDFSGARLVEADLRYAVLTFAKLVGADLRGANLAKADLVRADLSGADLTGADLSEANLDGAVLTGVKGLDTVKGLALAQNLDRATR